MTANLLSVIEQQHKALESAEALLTSMDVQHLLVYKEIDAALAASQQALEQTQVEALGFISPKQLSLICDPDEESGVYIPMRKTAAGNFTMALYAATHPQATEPAPSTAGEVSQFLSDVLTAAGLIAHGKQSKALGERLGAGVMRYRAALLSAPAMPAAAMPVGELTTCNCRWDGEKQVQSCTLHEAHVDAIHEWAERAKTAERELAAASTQPVRE